MNLSLCRKFGRLFAAMFVGLSLLWVSAADYPDNPCEARDALIAYVAVLNAADNAARLNAAMPRIVLDGCRANDRVLAISIASPAGAPVNMLCRDDLKSLGGLLRSARLVLRVTYRDIDGSLRELAVTADDVFRCACLNRSEPKR